jgi:hypothetical protein
MPESGTVDPAAGYCIVSSQNYLTKGCRFFSFLLGGGAGVGVKLLGIASTYPPPTRGGEVLEGHILPYLQETMLSGGQEAGRDSLGQLVGPGIAAEVESGVAEAGVGLLGQKKDAGKAALREFIPAG